MEYAELSPCGDVRMVMARSCSRASEGSHCQRLHATPTCTDQYVLLPLLKGTRTKVRTAYRPVSARALPETTEFRASRDEICPCRRIDHTPALSTSRLSPLLSPQPDQHRISHNKYLSMHVGYLDVRRTLWLLVVTKECVL